MSMRRSAAAPARCWRLLSAEDLYLGSAALILYRNDRTLPISHGAHKTSKWTFAIAVGCRFDESQAMLLARIQGGSVAQKPHIVMPYEALLPHVRDARLANQRRAIRHI